MSFMNFDDRHLLLTATASVCFPAPLVMVASLLQRPRQRRDGGTGVRLRPWSSMYIGAGVGACSCVSPPGWPMIFFDADGDPRVPQTLSSRADRPQRQSKGQAPRRRHAHRPRFRTVRAALKARSAAPAAEGPSTALHAAGPTASPAGEEARHSRPAEPPMSALPLRANLPKRPPFSGKLPSTLSMSIPIADHRADACAFVRQLLATTTPAPTLKNLTRLTPAFPSKSAACCPTPIVVTRLNRWPCAMPDREQLGRANSLKNSAPPGVTNARKSTSTSAAPTPR